MDVTGFATYGGSFQLPPFANLFISFLSMLVQSSVCPIFFCKLMDDRVVATGLLYLQQVNEGVTSVLLDSHSLFSASSSVSLCSVIALLSVLSLSVGDNTK